MKNFSPVDQKILTAKADVGRENDFRSFLVKISPPPEMSPDGAEQPATIYSALLEDLPAKTEGAAGCCRGENFFPPSTRKF